MKKFLASILAIVYLVSTTGFAVNMHFCMGRPSSVELGYHASRNCAHCGMENKKGCCHSEVKIVKLSSDQQRTATDNLVLCFTAAIARTHAWDLSSKLRGKGILAISSPAPPGKSPGKVYLLCSVFRI